MAKTVARPGFPEYEDHRLTLDGMKQVLAEGGTVIHQGRVLTQPSHLPNASELTYGNADREKAVKAAIQKQIADLTAQMQMIGTEPQVNLSSAEAGHGEETHPLNLVAGLPSGDQSGAVTGEEQERKYDAAASGEGLHPTVGPEAAPAPDETKRGRGAKAE